MATSTRLFGVLAVRSGGWNKNTGSLRTKQAPRKTEEVVENHLRILLAVAASCF
jgi:hypothetical protein